MAYFEQIAAVIILISSVIIAIDKISSVLGKPFGWNKERIQRSQELSDSIHRIQTDIDEIKTLNKEQSIKIERIQRADLDMLRQNIIYIYNHHKKSRKLNESEREYLDDLYRDYTIQGGNSYIEKLYNRIIKWDVVSDEEDDE